VFQTLKNAWKIPELKSKLLFTLLIVVLYRLGANIPVPFVSSDVLATFKEMTAGSIFQYMNLLSGEAFGRATLFALSVSPYITASIVIQLLTIALPPLEKLAKSGEEGKKKLTAITRYATVGLALITAWGYSAYLKSAGMLTNNTVFAQIVIIACYCAGASLIMWLAEKINEKGIGNGISIILFANIIASLPSMLSSLWYMVFTEGGLKGFSVFGLILAIFTAIGLVAAVVLVVWFTNSERRIPIQYAKRVVGRKMYGGQSSNLPISLNMNGVMPIIFASSIVSIPATIAMFFPKNNFMQGVANVFNYTSPLYLVLYIILIFAFAFFYVMISFNPIEVANNIKNNGGAVPGIRTGRPTAEYISKVLNRITLLGALFLAVIAGVPMLINMIISLFETTAGAYFGTFAFGGSSLLIVVGVALETFRDMEAQMTMRNYKGFLD